MFFPLLFSFTLLLPLTLGEREAFHICSLFQPQLCLGISGSFLRDGISIQLKQPANHSPEMFSWRETNEGILYLENDTLAEKYYVDSKQSLVLLSPKPKNGLRLSGNSSSLQISTKEGTRCAAIQQCIIKASTFCNPRLSPLVLTAANITKGAYLRAAPCFFGPASLFMISNHSTPSLPPSLIPSLLPSQAPKNATVNQTFHPPTVTPTFFPTPLPTTEKCDPSSPICSCQVPPSQDLQDIQGKLQEINATTYLLRSDQAREYSRIQAFLASILAFLLILIGTIWILVFYVYFSE